MSRYEYRVVGYDAPQAGDKEGREVYSAATVKDAKAKRAEMKRCSVPYDDVWIERRIVPGWERYDG